MDKVKKLLSGSKEEDGSIPETTSDTGIGGHKFQPSTSDGMGGGVSGSSGTYGATPGRGLSFYSNDSSTSNPTTGGNPASSNYVTTRPFATSTTGQTGTGSGSGESALSSTTGNQDYTSTGHDTITRNAPQIGSTNAPQVGKQDFGDRFDPTNAIGNSATSSSLTSAVLAERSVTNARTSSVGGVEPAYQDNKVTMRDSHPTFTGNRLDPRFHESTNTFHEEQLDDKTHHGGGWKAGTTASNPTGNRDNAALGASAVAVGGAFGSSRDSGPASKTIGHHESNLANVVDPRVQPDPSLQGSNAKQSSGGHPGKEAALGSGGALASAGNYQGDEYQNMPGSTGSNAHTLGSHKDREQADENQTKGGPLGFLRKSQTDRYDDSAERKTTASDEYFGVDGVTPTMSSEQRTIETSANRSGTHDNHDSNTSIRNSGTGAGGTALGGAAAYESQGSKSTTQTATETTGTNRHVIGFEGTKPPPEDYSKVGGFKSPGASTSAQDGHRHETPGSGSTSATDEEKKPGFISKLLHRDNPNKLHKDQPQ